MCPPPSKDAIVRGKPPSEVDIDEQLVRTLLAEQHPDLLPLPLTLLDSGWDNVMYRLGTELTVRLPRRAVAAPLIVNEQTWLPKLKHQLPLPISAPERIGVPGPGYPWHWSVLPWFEGHGADEHRPAPGQAERWAEFLKALHQNAPAHAPVNEVRGIPLGERQDSTEERLERLRAQSDAITPAIEAVWQEALAAPIAEDARWLHGDLHAQNVLVDDAFQLAAVIDWGDITSGDVATDLASIWTLFDDADDRERVLASYDPDAPTLARSKGWALIFGMVLLDSGLVNNPRHAAQGRALLNRLTET